MHRTFLKIANSFLFYWFPIELIGKKQKHRRSSGADSDVVIGLISETPQDYRSLWTPLMTRNFSRKFDDGTSIDDHLKDKFEEIHFCSLFR